MIENETKLRSPVGFNAEHVIPLFSGHCILANEKIKIRLAIYSGKY